MQREREGREGEKEVELSRSKTWSQKGWVLKKKKGKKKGIEGKEASKKKTKPRGTDIHFGKVAPKT